MQRSSETIGTIAAALAKAQAQLINPEKSLVGTVRSDLPGGTERSFRYAPLSSGLDIVRKTLSQHEIATVQTTTIDETAGIVRLSTVLAHASGEWIASDWPVCPISETASPHRMGAALTYARRYALFTLVGIAGEDDLDAPDLITPTPTQINTGPSDDEKGRLNGGPRTPSKEASARATRVSTTSNPVLEPIASAALRDKLIAELKQLNSADDAADWAHRMMRSKNSLMGDREHVKSVAKQPCLVCGRRPTDAHHLRSAQVPALGRKVSDEFTVPLCRGHHREIHLCGDEAAWWNKTGIDPMAAARVLWLKTHPLQSAMDPPLTKERNEANLPAGSP
jgi:hypothetical protein